MAAQQHRPVQDIAAPQIRHDGPKGCCDIGPATRPGAGRGAKQAQPEDGPAVRVDASGRCEHSSLGFKTDDPETFHGAALGAGLNQSEEVGLDRGGAAAECAGVHVGMAAGVDMADQAGLWPGLDLEQKTPDGNGRRWPPPRCRSPTWP